ncbi:MAG: AAA family ATPase [Candidatus Tectomicrobia bacterium]|nr:AAA family ATPase [Candidatus Tectomicrobia bacterium]MBI3025868.1 AAA family ATPase [Candidatus Tectomicrobia bacterium]
MANGPEPAAESRPLHVLQVADLPPEPLDRPAWLIDELWADEAVGIIGGAPKCCKTYLALEMALAVASGRPCLGRFHVPVPGPVLLFAAEDSPLQVRARLLGLAHARGVDFRTLPVFLILAQQLRLDLDRDKARLAVAIEKHRPRLLVLDPFVRLHRLDENSAMEVSALLADLRVLQRRFHLAVLLVHHTRKANGESSGGQALRGSSDLHAWGDSNLYLGRSQDKLRLAVEHRAARAPQPITLTLVGDDAPHLEVDSTGPEPEPPGLEAQVLALLGRSPGPLTQQQLRSALKVRNQSLTAVLRELLVDTKISRDNGGWMLPR